MSSQSNKRTDAFGGSASKRVEIVVRIIKAVREATSPNFIIGMKLNSVDQAHSGDTNEDFVEQVRRINEAGIDFLEVSGGSYESPSVNILVEFFKLTN
jgi:2,4-dienoyl-CoA reductase-like NADH-dependent reductase (Old Yellow Enzyme family)